jgi:2-oxoglutarate dehydrogenase E2 component (dihydrolipoamide succinyltransferase)
MRLELKIPTIGESITEVEIGGWLKKSGEVVAKDEPVVTLESEKATVELPAPDSGTLSAVLRQKGDVAKIGEVIGYLETGNNQPQPPPTAKEPAAAQETKPVSQSPPPRVMPAAQVALEERGLRAEQVRGTGPGGRILKEDVLTTEAPATQQPEGKSPQVPSVAEERKRPPSVAPAEEGQPAETQAQQPAPPSTGGRQEEVVPMSRLRRTVAQRLVEAQNTAALLTTFNEVDMSAVMALRKEHGEAFQQKYQVKLGFMSFFVKASIDALQQFPALNAEVRDTQIVYHNYYDIGVAVGGGKGLAVPVLRNAERLSFAQIELAIGDLARRARDNKLKLEELQGGTFTISNGGVYGSLLSTPIINPPQSGILGLHAIQERPVAREGAVVIRPMMYVALTYDHRLVDGREAVSFLKRIKEVIENPARMLMEV